MMQAVSKTVLIRATRWILAPAVVILLLFTVLDMLFPIPAESLHPASSTVVFDRNGMILRVSLAPDDMFRMPVQLDGIADALKDAVLAYEDRHFYRHFGINPISVIRAAVVDIKAGGFVQGASTITMQVARMIEPKERTICSKLIEVFRAIQLELRYSKDEILAFYLNHAPYGGNIVGVGAASYLYFDESPRQLSIGDAALLAAIPNSPSKLRPDVNHDAALRARAKVLRILEDQGRITPAQKAEALSEQVPARRYSLPFEIPHLSTHILMKNPGAECLVTTIDAGVQELAEDMLQTRLAPLRGKGIGNGAVVVIDNETRDVLALVGSQDFFDEEADGQVNGAMAPRSPGSALKPFVYALGLDRGLISQHSLLYDVPVDYSGYTPENYDACYSGAVTVREALIRSLNVPAVNLSARLGEGGIHAFLKRAGISTLPNPQEYYGLSLVLGGCEVTLLELTNLYAGLANGGRFRDYRILMTESCDRHLELLSPEACYILSEMLAELRRPDLPSVWEWSVDMPKVAWKTGTSYGRRDAWSIGYTPRYTVGVWVGNFDGSGVPELVGAEAAAPVLFGIIGSLEKNSRSGWFVEPAGVDHRQVCSVSGMPLSEHCSTARDELFIPGVSPYQKCNIHKKILVDKETGYRLCRYCRVGRECDERIVEQWPAEIATWLQRNGYPVDDIPEHYPGCPRIMAGSAPLINSPSVDCHYKLRHNVALEYQKILLDASVSNHSEKIYWFLDNELIFSGPSVERVFILPTVGVHTIVCSDDEGRSSEVKFTVR